jgi:hypothetical protein
MHGVQRREGARVKFSDAWPDPEAVTLERLFNLTDQAVPMVVFRDFCPAHLSFLVTRDEILNRPAIIVSPTMRAKVTEWAATRGLHVEIEPPERTALYRGDAPLLEDAAAVDSTAVLSIRLENVIPGRHLGVRYGLPSARQPEDTVPIVQAALRYLAAAAVEGVEKELAS